MTLAKRLIQMKCKCVRFFLVFAMPFWLSAHVQAQTEAPSAAASASSTPNADTNTVSEAPKTEEEKDVPDIEAKRTAALKAQYPASDLQNLSAPSGDFTALWRKDRSGDTFGALLIIPTDGQTANWPNTIDVLRTELPKAGWSTLSIDIETLPAPMIPARPEAEKQMGDTSVEEQEQPDTTKLASQADSDNKHRADPNMDRIKTAIEFLHAQGQYNIVLAGYGNSAARILEYAHGSAALGMKKNIRSPSTNSMRRPIRAMILINPSSARSSSVNELVDSLNYKNMPILDLVVSSHYQDTENAKRRKIIAKGAGLDTYIQVQLVEPSTLIFEKENRLSRRVRGFLNKYAKGVEIGKES